jgi:large subunit ribosomal protein L19
MINTLVQDAEKSSLRGENTPKFDIGDSVDVHTRIVEGEKERIQVFSGTVIMRKGRGINETFTVRRIVNNEGVERIFPVHSPFIAKLIVKRGGESRRAKLFYLRDRVGKAVRLGEKRKIGKKEVAGATDTAAATTTEPELATTGA